VLILPVAALRAGDLQWPDPRQAPASLVPGEIDGQCF
jgi:hypothetical protein